MIKETDPNTEIKLLSKLNVIDVTGFRTAKKIIVTIKNPDGTKANLIYNFTDEKTYYNYNLFNRKLKKTYCNIFI